MLRVAVFCRDGEDPSIFPTSFDTFVAVLVQGGKVLPELLVGSRDGIAFTHRGEAGCQIAECIGVEFVLVGLVIVRGHCYGGSKLVYLEITELCELLAAAFKPASEGLGLLVNDLVCTHVASLGEPFAAGFA